MKLLPLCLLFLAFVSAPFTSEAKGVYQTKDSFITQAFDGTMPKAKVLWLNKTLKADIEQILAHKFNKLRLRYWQQDDSTVWIMDEVGKESPITVAVHVSQQQIVKTKVLEYRETRGGEVKHDFFTDQFKAAKLQPDLTLDKHIDGITGATLSVRALTKLSRIALYLDAYTHSK